MADIATRTKIMMCTLLIVGALISGCVEDEPITSAPEVETPIPIVETVSTPTPESTSAHTPISEPTPEPTPEAFKTEIGEACGTEYLTVGVKSYEVMDKYQYMGYSSVQVIYPKYHHQFIVFDCAIENKGIEQIYAGAIHFSMEDQNKYRYDPCDILYHGENNQLEYLQELYQGQLMDGKIAFEIPTDSTVNTLYYDFGSIVGTNLAGWNVTLS